MNDIVELPASSHSSPSVMTVFVLDGFQINEDSSVMAVGDLGDLVELGELGEDNNNNKADTTDLGQLGHWRLETCLPEVRLASGDVEPPCQKPAPPPRPGNLKTKLLEYKQAKGGLTDSGVTLTNTDRDRPQKDGDLSRLQSKIPILKGSRSRVPLKTENFPHKICLKIETSRVEDDESGGQPDLSLSLATPSLGGSCSGRTTPASLIPRPCPSLTPRGSSSLLSLPGSSSTPVRRWFHQSRDSLEVEFSQILRCLNPLHSLSDVSRLAWLAAGWLVGPPTSCVNPGHYSGGWPGEPGDLPANVISLGTPGWALIDFCCSETNS